MRKLLAATAVLLTVATAAHASQAYDRNGRLAATYDSSTGTYHGVNGSVYRNVTRGNVVYTYDTSDRLQRTGFRRGNRSYIYDPSGRLVARGFFNRDNSWRLYDAHGRFIGSGGR